MLANHNLIISSELNRIGKCKHIRKRYKYLLYNNILIYQDKLEPIAFKFKGFIELS